MKIPKKVKYLVVGGGLIGLSIFKKLQADGKDALLIEKSGELGGSLLHKSKESCDNTESTKQKFSLESLIWTQEKNTSVFKYDFSFQETLCLGKKGLIPFMGFGEEKVPAPEVIDLFASNEIQIVTGLEEQDFPSKKIALHTQITALAKADGSDDYNFFEINGKTYIEAAHVIWTAPIQELDEILPKEAFGPFRQKIKKSKHFDVITAKFEIAKEELGDFKDNKFIFMGEEQTPWLGCALNDDQFTFVSFYDANLSGDHDFIRKHLKTLKRRLHKAFPEVFTDDTKGLSREKITLHRSAVSSFSPAKKDWQLKDLKNFSLLSSHKSFWPHPIEEKLKFSISDEAQI